VALLVVTAAELSDLVEQDMKKCFGKLAEQETKVTVSVGYIEEVPSAF
jgi:hypothetical protein